MLRDGLVRDSQAKGVAPDVDDAFVWSMWRGYLQEDGQAHEWARQGGAEVQLLHTGGHAAAADLKAFASAIAATRIVPVHGENWQTAGGGFPGLVPITNGEVLEV